MVSAWNFEAGKIYYNEDCASEARLCGPRRTKNMADANFEVIQHSNGYISVKSGPILVGEASNDF